MHEREMSTHRNSIFESFAFKLFLVFGIICPTNKNNHLKENWLFVGGSAGRFLILWLNTLGTFSFF